MNGSSRLGRITPCLLSLRGSTPGVGLVGFLGLGLGLVLLLLLVLAAAVTAWLTATLMFIGACVASFSAILAQCYINTLPRKGLSTLVQQADHAHFLEKLLFTV